MPVGLVFTELQAAQKRFLSLFAVPSAEELTAAAPAGATWCQLRLRLAATAPLDGFSAVKVRVHLPEPGSPSASPPCVPSSLLRSSVALTESNVAQSTQSSYDNRSTCAQST